MKIPPQAHAPKKKKKKSQHIPIVYDEMETKK